jgi:hypothetical protein
MHVSIVEESGKHSYNQEHKNKQSQDAALQKIVTAMNLEEYDISAARKKIRILRSTYWNERTKIMNSQKSGAGADSVYKPKIALFSAANQFLVRVSNWRESHSNFVSSHILYLKYTNILYVNCLYLKVCNIYKG